MSQNSYKTRTVANISKEGKNVELDIHKSNISNYYKRLWIRDEKHSN